MAKVYKTPGVYIEEKSAFPNSAVPVATAVPAFIGYTEKATRDKKSLLLKPTKISSYGEYQNFFGGQPNTLFEIGVSKDAKTHYQIKAIAKSFNLHSQMRLFFANGGSDCYIVSVGLFENSDQISLEDLKKGIAPLLKEPEPTLLVIPEAIMVAIEETDQQKRQTAIKQIYLLYQEMLKHCGEDMRNRFAILDVWMDRNKSKDSDYDHKADIDLFREGVGSQNLQWGAAYYPWLHTNAIPENEISIANLKNRGTHTDILAFDSNDLTEKSEVKDPNAFKSKYINRAVTSLLVLLDNALNQDVLDGNISEKKATLIKEDAFKKIPDLQIDDLKAVSNLHQSLLAVSPTYKALIGDIRQHLNLLPPSAIMAGIYSNVDNNIGVFQSPANISLGSVIKTALSIDNKQQEDLNVPLDGKAVNAIRSFHGKGVLVWGARTLDGNSQDWRYISVRRTVIFIEQSIKYAIEPYVFEPNTATTWSKVKSLITNFLTNVWQSGALAGAKAEDAFSVDVGLGTTMTPTDILDGYIRVSVKLAVTRPGEFIVITFEQKMQQS